MFTDATIKKCMILFDKKIQHGYLSLFRFYWHTLIHADTLPEVVPAWPCTLVIGIKEKDLLKGLEG
uniref:Uncharacterized protein n=1 Tax=Arundo donax TaxID=35708 RepID=A0A0A9END2_ARUDO